MTPQLRRLFTTYQQATAEETEWGQARTEAHHKRCKALAQINAQGYSYAKIAAEIGLSRPTVQKMVERGRQ